MLTRVKCTVLLHFTAVSKPASTSFHVEAVRVLTGMLPMLDLKDPYDNSLKLVSVSFYVSKYFLGKKNNFDDQMHPLLIQCIVYHATISEGAPGRVCTGECCNGRKIWLSLI